MAIKSASYSDSLIVLRVSPEQLDAPDLSQVEIRRRIRQLRAAAADAQDFQGRCAKAAKKLERRKMRLPVTQSLKP